MKRYNVLASNFVRSLDGVKIDNSKIFRIDSKGNRVINRRTKIYKMVSSEIGNLLKTYTKQTVKNIIGVYNKALISSDLEIVGKLFKAVYTPQYMGISKEYKERLEQRTNNAIFICGGAEIINMAVDFIQTYDYKKISIGLAILTGRRTAEILHTANFKALSDDYVFFTGQLKQNDNNGYSIPVLCHSQLVVKALENLRILRSYKSINHVNLKDAKPLNQSVKKYLNDYCESLTMHDLRRFYAYVCYHYRFHSDAKKGNRQTFDGYTKEILGHRILKSGESYKVLEVEM